MKLKGLHPCKNLFVCLLAVTWGDLHQHKN